MGYIIRDFQETDYAALAGLVNQTFPGEQTTADEMLRMDRMRQPKHFLRHLVVCEPGSGRLIGFGRVGHGVIQYSPDLHWLRLAVHPDYQRRGIASDLYRRLEAIWSQSGVARLRVEAREDNLPALGFLRKFGFREDHRVFESSLDLARFDPGDFVDPQPILKKEGYCFSTLAAESAGAPLMADSQLLNNLFELTNRCVVDIPSPDPPQPLSPEAFFAIFVDSPLALREGFQLAAYGGRFIGLSVVSKTQQGDTMRQRLTGVVREHRRKGLAFALKLQGLRFAKTTGARLITTSNDTINTGMLAINQLLGFQPEPSWINFEKRQPAAGIQGKPDQARQ